MRRVLNFSWVLGEFLLSQECRIWLRMALKPLAVLATLALFLWLGAWFDTQIANHIAHAEAIVSSGASEIQAQACPPGTEPFGNRCYAPCPAGTTPSAITADCLKPCSSFRLPSNGLSFNGGSISPIAGSNQCQYEPASYGRRIEVRKPSLVQGCELSQERQGAFCYPRCKAGFYGSLSICWEQCPNGYVDDGAFCRRPNPLQIFAKKSESRATFGTMACNSTEEQLVGNCYVRCPRGFDTTFLLCQERCFGTFYAPAADKCIFQHPVVGDRDKLSRGDGVPLNSIPVAQDSAVGTGLNTAVTFQTSALDQDVLDLPNLQFALGNFSNGTHTVVNGNRVYTPNPGFQGVDTMRWTVSDGKHQSNIAIVVVVVGTVGPNSAPVALDRTVAVSEDTPITITVTCTDAENDDLFYQLIDEPQHGDYQWLPPNTVIYTPTLDFVGTDSFTFRSDDGREASNISTITLTVGATNDAPVAEAQTITTTRNYPILLSPFASDVESDTLTYRLVTSPTHGTVSGELPDLLYTPQRHFVGNDSVQFQASDPHGATSIATIQITVQPTNTAPLAESIVLTTVQENLLSVNFRVYDADDDALTHTFITSPTQGTLRGEGADWVYTPNAGFIGTDSIMFQSNDGQADSAVATVTIQVLAAPNEASVAGILYEDRNGTGQPDGEDVGVAGLLVTLTPASGRTGESYSTLSEAGGGWRIDGVPFGQYTAKVTAGSGVQIEQPIETPITVGQRGLQQTQPSAIKVTSRALLLPLIQR